MARRFAQDYPLSNEEIHVLRKLETNPEIVEILEEWDTLCDLMERNRQYMVSQRRHELIEKYSNVLDKYNLLD